MKGKIKNEKVKEDEKRKNRRKNKEKKVKKRLILRKNCTKLYILISHDFYCLNLG